MKLLFILRGIPTNQHPQFDQFKLWKIPVTRYAELRNYQLTAGIPHTEQHLTENIVLFLESSEGNSLNKNWGWREYILKKL